MEVGLYVQTGHEAWVVKKSPEGHPVLTALLPDRLLARPEQRKLATIFYEGLTGVPYPHAHATTRQVLWDFLEVAIRHLP